MKTLILLFVSFFFFQNVNLTDTRKAYSIANANKESSKKFYELLTTYSGKNNTLLGYKGAAYALKSKHVGTKETKKDNFINGVNLIESSIKSEPTNLELRLIRLSIQENIPKFMKYKMNMNEDKDLILKQYNSQSSEIKQLIKSYVKTSKFFNETEKQKLN